MLNTEKFKFRNPYSIYPPGSNREIVPHPVRANSSVDIAIFQSHRYAFFYWLKWTNKLGKVPCLVSFDWHQDLCFPDETEKKWLLELDQADQGEVAFFSWAKLAGNNDGHILCAAYLNLIGNIYVHCRQGTFSGDWEDEELADYKGNVHLIKKFKTSDDLENFLLNSKEEMVYFDIDLDFFTLENNTSNDKQLFTYLTDDQIERILSPDTPLMNWIFERLEGMTIATEPECTCGLMKSNELLAKINSLYFSPDLFTWHCSWKWK